MYRQSGFGDVVILIIECVNTEEKGAGHDNMYENVISDDSISRFVDNSNGES